jgi:hypothetical protein
LPWISVMTHKNIEWNEVWRQARFRYNFIITIAVLLLIAFSLNYFFVFIENRKGYVFQDPILVFTPKSVSVYTFLLIYSAVIIALYGLLSKPVLLLKGLQALAMLMVIRMIVLYFVPLEAPSTIIPLQDPFIEKFFYGQTRITKDLFFSGHVSILCLIVLIDPIPRLKWFFAVSTILVAVLILVQHVHYTIDVMAAPLFAWFSYKLSKRLPAVNP